MVIQFKEYWLERTRYGLQCDDGMVLKHGERDLTYEYRNSSIWVPDMMR